MPGVLKWIGIAFLILVLIIGALSIWLLRTESGLHFVLARAIGATNGNLTIEKSSGSVAGPLTVEKLRYRDASAGVDVTVRHVVIAFSPLELISARLHITQLALDGLDVALTTVPATPTQPAKPFSLAAPLEVVLDRLTLTHAQVNRDGAALLAIDALDVIGRWTHDGIALTSLAMRSPDGTIDMHGTVSALAGYPGNGSIEVQWKVGDIRYAGTLTARGDGNQAHLDLALVEPTAATVNATLTQKSEFPWTAKVSVPRFDPKRVQKDSTLTTLALDLAGSGDREHGTLSGEVAINDHRVELDPLRYGLIGKRLKIEALTLKSPEAPGTLHANGEVQLDASPVSATLALDWQDVVLPPDLAGQSLATHGKLDASGSAEKFHAQGQLSIGPPGKLADIAVNLDGTPDAIVLRQLALKQARGGLDAHGTVKLQPAIGWQISAKADKFDPGAFAAAWPGALNFDLASDGSLTDRGPVATIKLERLSGTLRKRPVSGSADLKIKPDYIVDGTLAVASGKSRIDVVGRGGNETDATVKLAIASLGDWLPDSDGSLDGQFNVSGKWPKLGVTGRAHGSKIGFGATHIGTLDLNVSLADIQSPQGTLDMKAAQISTGPLAFDTLTLDGNGNKAAHQLDVAATGTPLGFKLVMSGSTKDDGRWNGTLKTLDVALKEAPTLALEQSAMLAWNGKQFSASEICLVGGGPKLCVAGKGGADGAIVARYRIERLPIALIAKLAAPDAPFKANGMVAGSGEIQRAANGALNGHATITSNKGSVAYLDDANQPLLAYSGLALDAKLSPQSTHATLHAALDHDGKLDGDVTLSGAPGSAQALSGHIDLTLNSLAFIELLTPEVANTKGRLAANYTLAGTTAAPQLNGALTLKQFAAEVPSAGLKLHDGDFSVRAIDADHFVLDGTLKSGDGTITVSGTGGVGATAPLKASIKGENFLVADIPAAKVVISPDLTIERSAKNITLGGSVTISNADVDLAKL
ncbi:MAG: translocation/assembly module TamB domain-containing protein, partial [Dokdonella sp.]